MYQTNHVSLAECVLLKYALQEMINQAKDLIEGIYLSQMYVAFPVMMLE